MTGPVSMFALSGPGLIPFLPTYIPADVDIDTVKADIRANDVSAPAADVPGLKQVVADARKDGINLKVVVVATNPPIPTPLRDVAGVVGRDNPGSTVLVVSPAFAGSFSPAFDRVTLEAGEDLAKTGNAVTSSRNFLGELTTPQFPWTGFTIVVVGAVIAAAIATRLLQVRSKRKLSTNTELSGA